MGAGEHDAASGKKVLALRSYTELIAWQKAIDLVEAVYLLSDRFPKDERFGLTAQLRRSAVSVPSNVAEGQGRWGTGEFIQFLGIAHGSLCELETQVHIAVRLGFIPAEDAGPAFRLATEVGKLIHGLRKSLA